MSYEIINGCFRRYADGREVCNEKLACGRAEYKRRREEMAERQMNFCAICMQWMREPTFDHDRGRGMSGSHRDDRIEVSGVWQNAALCDGCQGKKGSKRYHWVGLYYVPVVYATLAEAVAGGHKTDRCDGGDAPWVK